MITENHIKDETCIFNYKLYYPEQNKKLPLLIYLHGAGERGDNIDHLDVHAIPRLIKNGKEYNAVVLCPQCPAEFVWNNVVSQLKKLIDETASRFGILRDRICITGSSMGGFGTFEMGLTYRNFFSCIAPVAGGGMEWRCQNLKTTPVKAYHGDIDNDVTIDHSIKMVEMINANGGNAELITLKNMGHSDGIEYAYEHTDLVEWALAQRRTDFSYVPECLEELF